jgi:glycosyltransferase involved in cell wall biosynthesis
MEKQDIIPFVSVCMTTYNHEAYIAEAIEGVLMQKTSFPFELLIHDDASTDGTADIIREYEARYPDIIKPIYQKENQYSKGVCVERKFLFSRVQGKYVAVCEGDDYWTNPLKLQKQVDFLESHPDYSICGGMYQTIYENVNSGVVDLDWLVDVMQKYPKGKTITLDNYFYPYLFWFLTVCVRRECLEGLNKYSKIKDDTLFAEALAIGKGYIFHDVFGVYRQHQGGIWAGKNMKEKLYGNVDYITELYRYHKDKSWCIRHGYYSTKICVLFYEMKEKNKIRVFFNIIGLIFSGKVRDFLFHLGFFFQMLYVYANSFFRRKLGLKPAKIAVEPHRYKV